MEPWSAFNIQHEHDFNRFALHVFKVQASRNPVYSRYLQLLHIVPEKIKLPEQIPFMPVGFFKNHRVILSGLSDEKVFFSSGTTGPEKSKHYVHSTALYDKSFLTSFRHFYGNPENYIILALLPGYLGREGSSLVYMMDRLIQMTHHDKSGFYHYADEAIVKVLEEVKHHPDKKVLLLGVAFSLLELAERYQPDLENIIVMETGGMKGNREELTREELHNQLKRQLHVSQIHSEYGMTELLSQAYASQNGKFRSPAHMKVFITEMNDPFSPAICGKTGILNVIDLANWYSCSFIQTQDIGKLNEDSTFEVLGRLDHAELRGCNLIYSGI